MAGHPREIGCARGCRRPLIRLEIFDESHAVGFAQVGAEGMAAITGADQRRVDQAILARAGPTSPLRRLRSGETKGHINPAAKLTPDSERQRTHCGTSASRCVATSIGHRSAFKRKAPGHARGFRCLHVPAGSEFVAQRRPRHAHIGIAPRITGGEAGEVAVARHDAR